MMVFMKSRIANSFKGTVFKVDKILELSFLYSTVIILFPSGRSTNRPPALGYKEDTDGFDWKEKVSFHEYDNNQ